MSDFKLKIIIGDAQIELEGEGELVHTMFRELRESGLGNISPLVHTKTQSVQNGGVSKSGSNEYFLFLSDLIPKYQHSSKWNTSRNLDKNIIKVKKYGDLSAHNRRYQAKQSDIDGFKFELRQVIQEMVLTIDYPNWDRSQ